MNEKNFRELLDSIREMKAMMNEEIAAIRVGDRLWLSSEMKPKAHVSKTFGDFIKLMRTTDPDEIDRLRDWWKQYQWEQSRG